MRFLVFMLWCSSVWGQPQLPSLFQSAAKQWLNGEKANTPLDHSIQQLLQEHRIRPAWLAERLAHLRDVPLAINPLASLTFPALALHAVKLTVLEASDDWMKDDLYCYFFVTDGVATTGKVTSIYRGLAAEESKLFKLEDRVLYPLDGSLSKAPQNHLILDYGIIESDGDDIRDLRKLTAVIIDLAAAVYASQDPQMGVIAQQLRVEVKALADALLATENDDELVTSTWVLDQATIDRLSAQTYVDIHRVHRHNNFFDTWKYRLSLRLVQ